MTSGPIRFYVAGGSLQHDAPCYVERQADRDLYEGLIHGEFCYVLTSRQMGKSSLMVHTAARLREEGVTVVLLDLTSLGRNLTVEQWYGGLLDHLGRQLNLEEELETFWLEHGQLGPLQRWMTALREVVLRAGIGSWESGVGEVRPEPAPNPQLPTPSPRLVLFIDEIDAVRSLTFSTDEFFAAVRECYNRRAHDARLQLVTFCLLGVAAPSDLIRDTRTTPFNIGRRIELTDFTEEEALPLAAGLGVRVPAKRVDSAFAAGTPEAEHRTPNTEHLLRRILYWTRGHPYLTQRLCQAVASANAHIQNPKSKIQNPKSTVDRLCHELFLSPQARERDTNLVFVRERLLRSDDDVTDLLELYARVWAGKRVPVDDTNRLVEILRLSGITRVEGKGEKERGKNVVSRSFFLFHFPFFLPEGLRVRNRIYDRVFNRQWVLAHMPDAELRRQRAAYRRGLLRATAVSGVILAIMAGLTASAVRNARESRDHLVRLNLYTGARAVEDGDPLGALPWFAEACRLDQGDPSREEMDRYRLAAVMRQSPRVVHLWSPGNRPLALLGWSEDLGRVVVARADGATQVWDTTTDTAVSPPMRQNGRPWGAAFSPDGQRVFIPCGNGMLRVWDTTAGRPMTRPLQIQRRLFPSAYIPSSSLPVTKAFILAAEGDAAIRVWNAATGRPVTPPLRHSARVVYAGFSPDGRRVVTGSEDHAARVWDATTGRPLTPPLRHDWWVTNVAFSPDGRRVVLCSSYGGTARVWDAATGKPLTPFLKHTREVPYAAFSPDSRRVATASLDGTARVWDADNGHPMTPYLKHAGAVGPVVFSPDGRWVATSSEDRTARVWDAATGEPLTPPLQHSGPVKLVSFRGEGRFLVTVDTVNVLREWDLATDAVIAPSFRHSGRISSASFSPDGRRILSSSYDDATTQVHDAATGQPLLLPIRPGDGVAHAEFSPDGRRIVAACWNRSARVWDAGTTKPITPPMRQDGSGVWAAFSPDSRRVVTTSDDHTARVWDAATGRAITLLLMAPGIVARTGICQFSPDGRWVVAGSDDGARVWDAATGRLLQRFDPYAYALFSAGGRRLLTWGDGSPDRGLTAQVWAASARAPFQPLGPPLLHTAPVSAAAFSPDGRRVVTASNGTAQVRDAATGTRLTPPMQHSPSGLMGVSFSPDGRRILTGGGAPPQMASGTDPTVRVWDAATGEPVTPPLQHRSAVFTAAFSPDGRRVVTGCADGTVRIWDVSPDDRPLPDRLLRAQVQAGRRIDATGGTVTMTPDEVRRAWQTLRSRYPREFVSTLEQTLAWYRHEAVECEQARQWSAAQSYLGRLIQARPVDADLWARRGSALAALSQWGPADSALSKAIQLGTYDAITWYDLARVQLARGDTNGYRRTCAGMLHRFGGRRDIPSATQIASTCALSPALPLPLSHAVAARFGADVLFDTTLGAALYRAGRCNDAVRRLNKAAALVPPGDPFPPALWLALCYHRLGQADQARQWLNKGERSVAQALREGMPKGAGLHTPLTWEERLEMQFLRHEAEALIGPARR